MIEEKHDREKEDEERNKKLLTKNHYNSRFIRIDKKKRLAVRN